MRDIIICASAYKYLKIEYTRSRAALSIANLDYDEISETFAQLYNLRAGFLRGAAPLAPRFHRNRKVRGNLVYMYILAATSIPRHLRMCYSPSVLRKLLLSIQPRLSGMPL